VKPANFLATVDGIVKVTDFGLARAKDIKGFEKTSIPNGPDTHLVSTGGMTLAYCSPEQSMGKKVSRKTDIWSWGVSVLEMILGKLQWKIGSLANIYFDEFLEMELESRTFILPDSLVELLQGCFELKPENRWNSFVEISESLKKIYEEVTGSPYARSNPAPKSKQMNRLGLETDLDLTFKKWRDPRWFVNAVDPSKSNVPASKEYSGRGRSIASVLTDLELYEDAETKYAYYLESGGMEQHVEFAELLGNKALIHDFLGDIPVAEKLYEQALKIMENLGILDLTPEQRMILLRLRYESIDILFKMGQHGKALHLCDDTLNLCDDELLQDSKADIQWLIGSLFNLKGILFDVTNKNHLSDDVFDKAISIFENLYQGTTGKKFLPTLAKIYSNKGISLLIRNQLEQSIDMMNLALNSWKECTDRTIRENKNFSLATSYINRGLVLKRLHSDSQAIDDFNEGIALLEQLVSRTGDPEVSLQLAKAYLNKGATLAASGNLEDAIATYQMAITILERLVYVEGRDQCTEQLAKVYSNQAIAQKQMGNIEPALTYYDTAIRTIEHLVFFNNRTDLMDELAAMQYYKGLAYTVIERFDEAVEMYNSSIRKFKILVSDEQRYRLVPDLVEVIADKIEVLLKLHQTDAAELCLNENIDCFKTMPKSEGNISKALSRLTQVKLDLQNPP